MMVHGAGGETDPDRLLRRRPGPRRDRAAGRAGRRSRSTSTPRRRRRSTSARPPAGCRAPRPGWSRRCERFGSVPLGRAGRRRRCGSPARGRRSTPSRPTSSRSSPRSTSACEGTRELYAPGGRPLREGDDVPLPGARRGARTLRRRRGGAVLPRRGRGGAQRLRGRARRHPRPRRPRRLRGDRAARRSRAPLPRRRGADQPAALLGRDPDRLHASACSSGSASAAGPSSWSRRWAPPTAPAAIEFAEALYEEGMEAGFLDPAGLDLAAGRPARLDHPHLGPRRRRDVRQRHLLQRLRLGGAGPGHRGDPQQHARRGGPQPARLPPDRARAPGALDDGADRGPARRRDRARPRQRRLQPDPLGDPADDRPRRSSRGWPVDEAVEAPRLHFERGVVQAEPGIDAAALARIEARRHGRSPAGPRSTYSSAACRRSPAIRRPARSAAAATRAAAAPSPTPEPRFLRMRGTAVAKNAAWHRDRLRGRGAARRARGRGARRRGWRCSSSWPPKASRWRSCARRSPPAA